MSTSAKQVVQWRGGKRRRVRDELALEEPLEIRVDTRPVSVTMRTPGDDEELAAGFLFTEGIVHAPGDIARIRRSPRNANTLDVFLAPDMKVDVERLRRSVFISSSCGLCGKASIQSVHRKFRPLAADTLRISARVLLALPKKLQAAQKTFARTGGLHAAAIFSAEGELVVAREDIGRHNAVDKVIGFGLRAGQLPFDRHVLAVSGRASFEIVQKALAARIPIVCAVSAPSSLAVEFARASGMTLVGFLRGDRLNVYAGVRRVIFGRD